MWAGPPSKIIKKLRCAFPPTAVAALPSLLRWCCFGEDEAVAIARRQRAPLLPWQALRQRAPLPLLSPRQIWRWQGENELANVGQQQRRGKEAGAVRGWVGDERQHGLGDDDGLGGTGITMRLGVRSSATTIFPSSRGGVLAGNRCCLALAHALSQRVD
ncbi:hypothetical protein OsJ_01462 [Oryza sativa Japonica Group]|uniref:Uncharacterized protein n=1 Tax=Oryza sativa subsp. japonica TaxID=39947 RepID=B9EVR7_ORYSJ|nr:hypothetical protein OsJ_01462 [Oryza sativa Japonica Group]